MQSLNSTISNGGKENKEQFFSIKIVKTLMPSTKIIVLLTLFEHDTKVVRLFDHGLK